MKTVTLAQVAIRGKVKSRYGEVFQGQLGELLNRMIDKGAGFQEVCHYMDHVAEMYDEAYVVEERDGYMKLHTGEELVWEDASYRDADTGYRLVIDGQYIRLN